MNGSSRIEQPSSNEGTVHRTRRCQGRYAPGHGAPGHCSPSQCIQAVSSPPRGLDSHGVVEPTTPALPIGKAGAVPRLFAPRGVWTGTIDSARNAVIFTTGPGHARPIVVNVFRGSARLGRHGHPMIQHLGGALHSSDAPGAPPPSVRTKLLLPLWTFCVRCDRSKGKIVNCGLSGFPAIRSDRNTAMSCVHRV